MRVPGRPGPARPSPAWPGAGRIAGAAVLAVALLSACRGRTPLPRAAEVDVDQGRFPHARHADIACTDCHELAAVLQGTPAMPGADDHAPCDRGQCHQDAFLTAPGPFCAVCHDSVDPTRANASPLAPYPPRHGSRALASEMSHETHLDLARMEAQVGFHVSCTDCHPADDKDAPTQPDHAVCGRCHAPEAALAPTMDQCSACHKDRPTAPSRRRRLIVGDLHFRHGNHRVDRRGETIACVECHTQSPEVDSVVQHPTPTTRACVRCHDDENRTPKAMRMRVCETCHFSRARTFGTLAPRSHLPQLERPEDHTLAFRRDHGADARKNPERCARCHSFMSGSTRAACDECHQVMRPQDHVITWREFDHGPAASARADRCATCHTGLFCTTCHARPPRSHFPMVEFRGRGHALPAQLNIRACMTCHDPQTMCAACHTVGGMR